MKRSWRGVIYLALVLFLSIIVTQQTVNAYFYERYQLVLVLCVINILIFPLALLIYRKERDND
ncbi:hypothetical protein DNH61_13730 [Paenibacillus sambharensis]|uniref:Uncharacterized protein n=1 Tax=Paenibacillus sambharensis TaxID=1803190 RepID=A0A2W1LKU2_9BACL|nr:hypothetical protein [Paenibacillus sambharensis]PZD95582.1 hypothetical protein DNH61_13730 [Paenibacillus sambharensis]